MQSFSSRLSSLRKERGLTQADCAKANQMQRSTYSGYESEGKEPSYESLCVLAEYFGVTTDYLLGVSNSRTYNDIVFINDTKQFANTYEELPLSLKQSVASSFDSLYSLLFHDMKLRNADRLDLYAELLHLIESKRDDVRSLIENNKNSDPLFISTVMTEQTNFKNEISSLLDQLLQLDISVSSKKSNRTSGKTAV